MTPLEVAELERMADARRSWEVGVYRNREQARLAGKYVSDVGPQEVLSLIATIRAQATEIERLRVVIEVASRQDPFADLSDVRQALARKETK